MSDTTSADKDATYSYDEIPYPSHPFEATHPDHIYTLAKLFMLEPTIPDNASILELGCAGGGNIIPLGVRMPGARVVGVDLSSKQIADGQKIIDAIGVTNVKLYAQDFQSIDESFGQFDYILCHGVFSWVPPHAQQRILEVCRERLTPNGVAYVSYNCYPGWFMRGMIRQMMLHHVGNIADPKTKIQQARAFLAFLVESTEGQETPYAKIIKSELDLLAKHPDSYLFHEHLEENNRPMFFYEFVAMAKSHGLQFLGESSLASMITTNLSPKAAESLTKLTTDVHHRGQYTDFVTNRMFRQSLLCHKEAKLNRNLDPSRIGTGYFAGNIQVEDASLATNLSPDVEVAFKCPNGRKLQTKNSALKALIQTLGEAWPRSLSISEIEAEIRRKLSETLIVGQIENHSLTNIVTTNMMQMVVRGDVEFRCLPDRFISEISERPATTDLARYQAKTSGSLTTQRHGMLGADPLTRVFIQAVDGTRNRAELASFLAELVENGKLNVSVKGDAQVDMAKVHDATVSKVLEQLRKSALLVG